MDDIESCYYYKLLKYLDNCSLMNFSIARHNEVVEITVGILTVKHYGLETASQHILELMGAPRVIPPAKKRSGDIDKIVASMREASDNIERAAELLEGLDD